MTYANIENTYRVLEVHDLECASTFYCERLGFTLSLRVDGHLILTRHPWQLTLEQTPRTSQHKTSLFGTHGFLAHFPTQDLDGLYQELLAKEILCFLPPTIQPWGVKEFGIEGPQSHRIYFFEALKEQDHLEPG